MANINSTDSNQSAKPGIRAALAYRFNLKDDQADPTNIDRSIRDGVVFKGTNLWVLMLAIFIASIGLNVNSTAVIIGAMLISPLMGPIMGIGYGAGINDFDLIKLGLKNLGIAILIGLFTSTLYFLVSPLSEAQSELLARTTPTIWDVLIALFGGLAGIVAATRKEKSNVIPGVAIATALMPPLCTAGYGIATGSAHYFLGAFYLFFINCVFIAFSTILVVASMRLPHKRFVSVGIEKKVHRAILAVVLVTVLPSIYLAYGLVTTEIFREKASSFIKKEYVFENTYIAKQVISPDTKGIEISLIGNNVPQEKLSAIAGKLKNYGLEKARLVNHQSGTKELDLASIRMGLLKDVLGSSQQSIEEKNKRILELEKELAAATAVHTEQQQAAKELYAQYPAITKVALAEAPIWDADGTTKSNMLIVEVTSKKPLGKEDTRRISAWLKVKMGVEQVKLISGNS
ncbi:MAG: DUF389 domain-containing protein [Gallionellaceae bacterium]|nr:DUF389 domain-containing protein [Gallionellaceae bacterium]